MTSKFAILLLVAVCALSGAQTLFAADTPNPAGTDFFAWYEAEIRPRPTGVYGTESDVLFHYRAPITGTGVFREQKSAAKAMTAVNQMVFAWISSNSVATSRQPGAFSGIPGKWFDRDEEAARAVRDLPSRVLHRGADGDDYVLTLCIAGSALKAEAAKGPLESRPDALERQWTSAVKKSITSPDRMAFFRDCGALDLWTILSETTSGTKSVKWSPETQEQDCVTVIRSLRDSAAGAPEPAASEWRSVLDGFSDSAASETNFIPSLAVQDRVRTMLLSFASCPAPPKESGALNLDKMLELCDEPATNTAATDGLVAIIADAPSAELPWSALGDRLLAAGAPNLALASFRNALRANHSGPLALDGLRRCYLVLGKPALARGAAALILAFAEDGTLRSASEETINRALE